LDDAQTRSAELKDALEKLDSRMIEETYWLNFIWRLLRDGNSFFIMV
jgi:hypothetical protein